MALPQLHWKKTGPHATGGVATAEDTLNAIYDAFQATQYHDATTRTPGSGSAWTATRYQNGGTTEAVYLTPPSAAVNGFRVILSGVDSGSPTPTMGYGSFVTGDLHIGINRASGAFNAWDAASPFTGGDFSGYVDWTDPSNTPFNFVHIIESEEAVSIYVQETADGDIQGVLAGALFDPLSTDPLDEEQTHQRIFGMAKSQKDFGLNVDHNTLPWFSWGGTPSHNFARFWQPNAGWGDWRALRLSSAATATSFILRSGTYTTMPILAICTSANPNYAIGFLRGIYMAQEDVFGTTISPGGVEKGHFVRGSTTTSGDTIFFRSN